MAVMALEDVVKQLQVNKRSTDDVRKVLVDFILMTKRNMLDQLESDRESTKAVKETTKSVSQPAKGGKKGGGFNLVAFGSLAGVAAALKAAVGTITAGVASLTLGIVAVEAGFRPLFGFEKRALTKIKGITQFPIWISNSVIRLHTAALAIFGLTPGNMPIKGADGKMMRAVPISTQIATKLASMKTAFLLNFGIGADGKNVARLGRGGIKQQPLWARAGRAMIRMLAPLTGFVTGITGWFTGKGLKIVTFAKDFIGKGGAKVFIALKRIFWPLNVLMSLFDGVQAYKDKEGTAYEKWGAGIGGFLGTMVGSMFDLAKGAINWILKKIIPGAVDADGNWDESTIIGGWLSTFESFSFKDTISNLIEALFAMPRKAIDWIKDLFKDPVPALWRALTGFFGFMFSMADILFLPMRLAIDWISKKLGWRETDAPVFSIKDFVFDMFHDVMKWFKSIGPKMKYAFDEWWINTKYDLQLGFLGLTELISELPARLTLMARIATVPEWAGFSTDKLEARLRAHDGFSDETLASARLLQANRELELSQHALNVIKDKMSTILDNSSQNTNVINMQSPTPSYVLDMLK